MPFFRSFLYRYGNRNAVSSIDNRIIWCVFDGEGRKRTDCEGKENYCES